MGSAPEISVANEVTGTVNGDVIQAGTVNLTKAVEPEVTAGSMAAARAAYARRVRETYGRLDLEVLTPLSEQGEHPAVELREVFVTPQVRENPPPVELPRELVHRLLTSGEFTAEELPGNLGQSALERLRNEYLNRPTEDVLSVLAGPRGERVVLLGDPGAGKSTLARYLALTLVQDVDGPLAPLGGLVPLVVELRQYAEGQWRERTFEDFLDHRHTVAGMSLPGPELRQLLTEGRVVVVFDGLDELFDPGVRAAAAERIAAFAARYDRARVVVTSRVIGYQRSALGGAGFTHFMLQDLDPERIAYFARRWYAIACPADAELAGRLFDRITSAVEASRPIRELAGNPLLLTILTIIGRRQTLPRDRQGVYEHAVRVLVAHWDRDTKHLSIPLKPGAAEALGLLDDRERLELLRLLARRMQEGTGGIAGNHIHAEELEEVFRDYFTQFGLPPHQCLAAARALRDQLRERNFILARYGGEVYGFVHRAFLEYLAAADIVHRYTVGRAWSPEELIEEVFERRTDDPAWHEVLLLVVNQLSETDAGRVVDRLLDRGDEPSLVLAFRSLAEVRKIGLLHAQSDRAVDRLISAFVTYYDYAVLHSDQLMTALSALCSVPGWTGRDHYLRWFHLRGQFLAGAGTATIAATTLHTDFRTTRALATFGSPATREFAVAGLARRWSAHPGIVAALCDLAVRSGHDRASAAALAELAERWPDHPRVPLPSVVGPDADDDRTAEVVQALNTLLTRLSADPDDHTPMLNAVAHESVILRATALQRLARVWPSHPEVFATLLDRAVNDSDSRIRYAAVHELATRWAKTPAVLMLLRERAGHDPDAVVRVRALSNLAAENPDDPGIVSSLTRAAVDAEPGRARGSALEALSEYRGSRDETALLLLDRIEKDPAHTVRGTALSCYAVLVPGSAEDVIRRRAADDPSPEVRGRALTMLAWQWPSSPETGEALRRALADPEVREAARAGLGAVAHLTSGT
ncbi:NACHT domain-containing protein [Kitasatospora sp. NPDC091257]|uniref:NACHT domain-containing protein n=1 Tax=Kitasatospora sp. NPDC091257 TaxID=3364084 RepID=UPI0038211261